MRCRAPPPTWSSCAGSVLSARSPPAFPRRAIGRRSIQLHAVPSSSSPALENGVTPPAHASQAPAPDARFEVIGSPYSLLSVELSASQNLYTRRGTLVAVNGKAENAVSTLSLLEPFRRAPLGVPFLYQKISSTSPITALLASKSPVTSFSVVHLDGRLDWIVAQRDALLAWTGHALSVKPKINTKLSLAHWGQSYVTGRGLLALVGKGQVYQVNLKSGEEYVVHPGNVVAYTVNQSPPLPYRFKSALLRFQVPTERLGRFIPEVKFFRDIAETQAWKWLAQALFNLRTWARRSIWGDRLFLRFHGPSTILLQSRGSCITDVLTTSDVNEIADTPAGAVQSAIKLDLQKAAGPKPSSGSTSKSSTAPPTPPTPLTPATPKAVPEPKPKLGSAAGEAKVDIKSH